MIQNLTISEFLEQTGAKARFFDMGRRVIELSPATVHAFEHAETPYPLPFQRHAWLGILFQHEGAPAGAGQVDDHHIWFVKLPLDEQGLLNQAARDDFLRRIAETFSTRDATVQQQILDDNPHGFTPREDRMAVFHAKLAAQLKQSASQFFEHAVDYFCGRPGFEQWNFVGLQGIADVVVRRADHQDGKTLQQSLIEAMPQLPDTPFAALCTCLENETIDAQLSRALGQRLAVAIQEGNANVVAACLRALSQSEDRATLHQSLQSVLDDELGKHVEVLAAIAGRAWECLEDAPLRHRFLENLAACPAGQQAFAGIMRDLLFMPALRDALRDDLHQAQGSQVLTEAIGQFLRSQHNKITTTKN